jgi:hypothetical protein
VLGFSDKRNIKTLYAKYINELKNLDDELSKENFDEFVDEDEY